LKSSTHYAHSLRNAPREHWHLLGENLEDAGDRAAAIAKKWDAEAWGRAAGRTTSASSRPSS
jgi:hypothetical protein